MRLGGAGGAADAVTAGTSAEEDDYIARVGTLTSDVLCGSRCDDRADLHALRGITVVVEFVDDAGGKADLVTIGAVAVSRGGDELALGQFALHGLGERLQRVCRAGDTHGRVDVGTAGQRVADGTTDAGGGSTEGFDLRRMVVGLILEEEQPVLFLAIVVDGHLDGTGVDLLGLIELVEFALLAEHLSSQGADVHEVHGLRAADALAVGKVLVIGILQERVLEGDLVDGGEERRMTAVVGPVGVDHTDLGDGRVSVFRLEVLLAERDVVEVHGKTEVFYHLCQLFPVFGDEPIHRLHGLRQVHLHGQGLRQFHGRLTGFDGVDDVLLDLGEFFIGDVTGEQVDLRGADARTVALERELDALLRGVRPLVELTRQVLDGEDAVRAFRDFLIEVVDLRLGEDRLAGEVEGLLRQVLRVIAVQDADIRHALDAEEAVDVPLQRIGLISKSFFFLNKNSVNHSWSSLMMECY